MCGTQVFSLQFCQHVKKLNIPYFCCFSDEAVVRKPVGLHEQVVRDAQGRVRFHGAFTGGFSAGYFNTVGSKEGEGSCSVAQSNTLHTDYMFHFRTLSDF